MKKLILMSVIAAISFPVMTFAEGNGNKDWAEQAAVGYEKKAQMAEKSGNAEAAQIYLRMAQIKRDAGAAGKAGQKFSWDEYHELEGKLNKTKNKDKKHKKHKKSDKKLDKKLNKKNDPSQGFLNASKEYRRLGEKALKSNDTEKAGIYFELAGIKNMAAIAAKSGNSFDWTRYEELQAKLKETK